ncbi:hypothetical protein, partial [Mesorhizobium sp.]|uniref:hypothetical protein n=1 Tax=Mesorhizobium sp. TaxID=1871066 RepID=UPI00257FC101
MAAKAAACGRGHNRNDHGDQSVNLPPGHLKGKAPSDGRGSSVSKRSQRGSTLDPISASSIE